MILETELTDDYGLHVRCRYDHERRVLRFESGCDYENPIVLTASWLSIDGFRDFARYADTIIGGGFAPQLFREAILRGLTVYPDNERFIADLRDHHMVTKDKVLCW